MSEFAKWILRSTWEYTTWCWRKVWINLLIAIGWIRVEDEDDLQST
jgi:hypothetical protein